MIAEESESMQKSRERLRKKLAAQDKLITASALLRTREKIHEWIVLHGPRVILPEKGVRLFDQNQNAATISEKVRHFAFQISGSIEPAAP